MIKDLFESKLFRGITFGIGICIIAFAIFQFGMIVGQHKARFAEKFGNAYERNFLGRNNGGPNIFGQNGPDMSGHGIAGKIISIDLPKIVVSGFNGQEQTLNLPNNTIVRKFQESLSLNDLKVGDFIVVLGEPSDNGDIETKLIRILPPPPEKDSNNGADINPQQINESN